MTVVSALVVVVAVSLLPAVLLWQWTAPPKPTPILTDEQRECIRRARDADLTGVEPIIAFLRQLAAVAEAFSGAWDEALREVFFPTTDRSDSADH